MLARHRLHAKRSYKFEFPEEANVEEMRLTTPIIVVCSLFWRARSSQGSYGHAEMRTGRLGLPPASGLDAVTFLESLTLIV